MVVHSCFGAIWLPGDLRSERGGIPGAGGDVEGRGGC